MKFIIGQDRNQLPLFALSMDQAIAQDNEVRLIGGKLVAGDSTKLRAQNSKKNNFNQGKIEKHIAWIDAKLDEYSKILASEDMDSVSETEKTEIQAKVKTHKKRKARYEQFQQQLEQTGETQISTSDPESRQLITRNNITEVAYNVQTTLDAQHNIPIDFKVTNQNDSKAKQKEPLPQRFINSN